jgi:hypothetical protein
MVERGLHAARKGSQEIWTAEECHGVFVGEGKMKHERPSRSCLFPAAPPAAPR